MLHRPLRVPACPARRLLPVGLLLMCAGAAGADPPVLGETQFFPGDDVSALAVEVQEHAAIAAGGEGYLVVWDDQRAVLSGFVGTAYEPLMGNQTDIYAMRLDANGLPMDPSPIVVSNAGRNQTRPQVAWNGSNWLVVWTSERADWYFFEDIVGVRVSPAGELLDAAPILIRPENNDPANDLGSNPCVASDGTDWLVAWEQAVWVGFTPYPALAGTRISAAGAVLDPDFPILRQNSFAAFGPRDPALAFAGGQYLLVWHEAATAQLRGQRLGSDLALLGGMFEIGTSGVHPRVAPGGAGYFVLGGYKGYRVALDGTVLDPTGIVIPKTSYGYEPDPPELAWTGANWATVHSGAVTQVYNDDADLWLVRVGTDGGLIDATPRLLTTETVDQWSPVIAGDGAGGAIVPHGVRDTSGSRGDDILGLRIDATGAVASAPELGIGLPRQENLSFVTANGVHLALYSSKVSGRSRLLAQRFAPDGTAIDPEPTIVHEGGEFERIVPAGAWNGSLYLVCWTGSAGAIVGKRLDGTGQPLDGLPLQFLPTGGSPGVGALGDNFLVAANYTVSSDLSYLRGVRVSGVDGSILDASPLPIGFNFALGCEVRGFGDRWLVVWGSMTSHDISFGSTYARFVSADGSMSATTGLATAGEAWAPGVALAGDKALIVWQDEDSSGNDGWIEGRLLNADGSFASGEFLIANMPNAQLFPAVGFDGSDFIVAWTDFRSNVGIEQLRGDIYAARVDLSGLLLDAGGGFPLSSGPLPEDLPAVAGMNGSALIAYDQLSGVGGRPEVQRLAYRVMNPLLTGAPEVAAAAPLAVVAQPNPFNPSTTLRFTLAESGPVQLDVHDVRGRHLLTLERGVLAAGPHAIAWNGEDAAGRRQASGVYLARLATAGGEASTRLVLLK